MTALWYLSVFGKNKTNKSSEFLPYGYLLSTLITKYWHLNKHTNVNTNTNTNGNTTTDEELNDVLNKLMNIENTLWMDKYNISIEGELNPRMLTIAKGSTPNLIKVLPNLRQSS